MISLWVFSSYFLPDTSKDKWNKGINDGTAMLWGVFYRQTFNKSTEY